MKSKLMDYLFRDKRSRHFSKIPPVQAAEMIKNGAILVDVRTPGEYAEGHIAGSILIPLSQLGTLAPKKLPDKEKCILVYCRSGKRSAEAAAALAQMGYNCVFDIGGITDWPYKDIV